MTTQSLRTKLPALNYPRIQIRRSKYESVKWLIALRMNAHTGILISSGHPTAEIAWSMLESPQWIEYAEQILEAEIAQALPWAIHRSDPLGPLDVPV